MKINDRKTSHLDGPTVHKTPTNMGSLGCLGHIDGNAYVVLAMQDMLL